MKCSIYFSLLLLLLGCTTASFESKDGPKARRVLDADVQVTCAWFVTGTFRGCVLRARSVKVPVIGASDDVQP